MYKSELIKTVRAAARVLFLNDVVVIGIRIWHGT